MDQQLDDKEENNIKCITSLSQYFEKLKIKIQKLGDGNSVWFRGVSSEEFDLIPSLYRATVFHEEEHRPELETFKKIYTTEQNIDANFSQKSAIFFANKRIADTPWNRYILKQHYGIKTRLFDWTENTLTALFFALSDNNEKIRDKNAKIWLLSPSKLNHYSVNKIVPGDKKGDFYKILPCSILGKKRELFNK